MTNPHRLIQSDYLVNKTQKRKGTTKMKRSAKIFFILFSILALFLIVQTQASTAPGDTARVYVQFEAGKKAEVGQALGKVGAEFHYEFDDLNTFVVTLPQAALNGLSNNPNVVLIEEDAPRYLNAQEIPYGIDMVQARDIWDANRDGVIDTGAPTGAGRTVCIIDSGLYTGHEDLAGVNVIDGYPATTWNTDGCGHGTHVAGTIAAAHNNLGVVGVSPGGVSLYIVKVFGDTCSWSYSSTLVDAANRCEAAGANVINMSLGGGTKSKTEENAFQNLYNKGVLSIAAAGNGGNTQFSYPASYPSVVSVAAIDSNKVVADFSQKNSQVELAAPGVGVLSTVPWVTDVSLTVDGVKYTANPIEFAANGTTSGGLVDGGKCASTGSWSDKVVLCERGDISFYDKVRNVQNSGGTAAVIFNNEPGNFFGTLGAGNSSTIPAISLSQEDGQFLVANKRGVTGYVVNTITKPGSGYEAWNGTSMATPHVSGVAALVWSANTSWTNAQIRDALQKTAFDLGAAGKDNSYGYGLVQAKSAWTYLGGGGEPPPPPPPPPGALSVTVTTDKAVYTNGNTAYITVYVSDGTDPVSGAAVSLEIITANNRKATGSSTTGSDGTVVFSYRVNRNQGGVGTYTVNATASKSGYESGSGSTTFQVQ
jgi:serine protease